MQRQPDAVAPEVPLEHHGPQSKDTVAGSLPPSSTPAPAADQGVLARALARGRANLAALPQELLSELTNPRLTVLILTKDRPEYWRRLFASLRENVRIPVRLLLVDDHSQPAARDAVRQEVDDFLTSAERSAIVELKTLWLERSIGCPRARHLAVGTISTDYVMFLDDDTVVLPGALEHLVHALDSDPGLLAVGAHLLLPDGTTQLCGGEYWEEPAGVLHFEPLGMGLAFDDPAIGPSGPCQWLAGAAVVFRREALVRQPLDPEMDQYYEDNEWFYRAGRTAAPGAFRRSTESLVVHYQALKGPKQNSPADILQALPYLHTIAHFYRTHGLVLEGAFHFAPQLLINGRPNVAAARLLLELLADCGPEWVAEKWLSGLLEPLFAGEDSTRANGYGPGLVAAARSERDAALDLLTAERMKLADAHRALTALEAQAAKQPREPAGPTPATTRGPSTPHR